MQTETGIKFKRLRLIIGLSDFCRVTEHLVRSILSVKGVSRRIAGLKSVKEDRKSCLLLVDLMRVINDYFIAFVIIAI